MCEGNNSKFIENRMGRRRVKKERGRMGERVTVKCGIMGRKRAKKGG
jgi:hypothetical protein